MHWILDRIRFNKASIGLTLTGWIVSLNEDGPEKKRWLRNDPGQNRKHQRPDSVFVISGSELKVSLPVVRCFKRLTVPLLCSGEKSDRHQLDANLAINVSSLCKLIYKDAQGKISIPNMKWVRPFYSKVQERFYYQNWKHLDIYATKSLN